MSDFSLNRLAKLKFERNDGHKIGEHQGAHFYTIGQRKGLNIGGKPKPLFVIQTNVEENLIFVGQGENHPGLLSTGLKIRREDAHWVRPSLKKVALDSSFLKCRIRYRQELFGCKLFEAENGDIHLFFEGHKKSVTSGQFAAVYLQDELVFSGVIQ